MSTTAKLEDPKTRTEESSEVKAAQAARAKRALYLIVFVSGAVLMGVEIAGAKILAPGFGTSTFVWGSIIGLFMGALAAGYYLGGMFADYKPKFATLATIVSIAGVWTAFVIPRMGPGICDFIAIMGLGTVVGPLLAAGAIFFFPSFLMGMVSPYAVKLNASSLSGLGSVTGRLYALSTLGSIIGTLITTFLLIPNFFVSSTMQALGLALIGVAIISLALFLSASGGVRREDRTGLGVMVLIALLCAEAWAVFPVEPRMSESTRLLHYEDSPYHEILVTEDILQSRDEPQFRDHVLLPVRLWQPEAKDRPWWLHEVKRWLKFNENIESGIYPYRDEYKNAVGYTDLLHLPLLWVNGPAPLRVLVVGGGGGIIPTQYTSWYKDAHVDVAEIDGAVERVAKKYFQVPAGGKNITFTIGDGRQTLKQMKDAVLKNGGYDVIVLDAYSSGGQIPFHLMTWEFLSEVKSCLSKRGVLITNIISGLRNISPSHSVKPADLFLAEYKTLKASRNKVRRGNSGNPADDEPLFKQVYVFPKVREGEPLSGAAYEEYRNVIVVATNEEKRLSNEQLHDLAKSLSSGENPVVKTADLTWCADNVYEPRASDYEKAPVMCDDFAPVDLMYRPVRHDETTRHLYLY